MTIKIPYIRVKQRSEIFYITKLKATFLKKHVNFHFRDPYLHLGSPKKVEEFNDYIDKIRKKGIELKSSEEGIQRRIQINRINDIKYYIESSMSNFFPNSVLLSVNVTDLDDFEDQYLKYEDDEIGYFELPDDIKFTIIDGQHRLAGLFITDETIYKEFEMPAVLLLNISISTAARLFADINGKQKPVNRSLIYDLYEEVDTVEFDELKKIHQVCQKFYSDEKSPLFRQIKMLGIGNGAISQAFFIDYVIAAIKKTDLIDKSTQEIYNQLFYYFKSYQKVFPEDWPVSSDFTSHKELDDYAYTVLKKRKSQLVKTNGFGAILNVFPSIHKNTDGSYKGYVGMIGKLKDKITWIPDPRRVYGTGKAFQNYLVKEIKAILNII